MIGSLRGRLLDRGPDGELLIEVGGVGHRVQVTPSTSVTIGELDGEVFVHTHHAVREDSETLYGFATIAERRVFESLISAHGVGPALGLAILSVHGPDALRRFGPERTTFGRDAVGEYTAATQLWTDVAGAPVLETTTREYGDSTWVLQQRWPAGCANGGARDGNEVLGAFPTFDTPPNAPTLNYASWGGNQLSDATVGRWLPERAAAAAAPAPPCTA